MADWDTALLVELGIGHAILPAIGASLRLLFGWIVRYRLA
jgi:hypothetical protein